MLRGIPHILSLQLHSGKLIHFSAKGKQTHRNRRCGPTEWETVSTNALVSHFWLVSHLNLTCVDV